MGFSCPKISTVLYSLIICLELFCGLVASSWTAFWNDREADRWAYIIFVIEISFAFILLYFTSHGIYSQWKGKRSEKKTVSKKRLCVVCTIGTIGILSILYYYNKSVLQDCNLDKLSWLIFWIFLLSYLALVGVSIYLIWDGFTATGNHHDVEGGENELVEMIDFAEASSHSGKIGDGATYLKAVDQFPINNSSQNGGECLS